MVLNAAFCPCRQHAPCDSSIRSSNGTGSPPPYSARTYRNTSAVRWSDKRRTMQSDVKSTSLASRNSTNRTNVSIERYASIAQLKIYLKACETGSNRRHTGSGAPITNAPTKSSAASHEISVCRLPSSTSDNHLKWGDFHAAHGNGTSTSAWRELVEAIPITSTMTDSRPSRRRVKSTGGSCHKASWSRIVEPALSWPMKARVVEGRAAPLRPIGLSRTCRSGGVR